MGYGIAEKIIRAHLVSGELKTGEAVSIRIDQTLTQDATGTMAYLEFEKMGIPRVWTEKSVAYVDHNTLQCGFENADDHAFIQSAAEKYGLVFSGAGNGICHQVHLERFARPGKTLVGSDSHTPTSGAVGMLSIGAGGMDTAAAMGGAPYEFIMPGICFVELTGELNPYVTAKDVALELLRRLTVKGGVGYIMEWGGPGLRKLSVPERATIANMGAELGATASIFPSDEQTRAFLRYENRENDYAPLAADSDAVYEKVIRIDLGTLEPLAACPSSPDKVAAVSSLSSVKVDQVCIGSCTNSSLKDLFAAASILKGRHTAPSVSLSVSPGSRQVLAMLSESGALTDLLSSGARILECACGPCIGMGLSPGSKGVSVRTFNRNFEGRSGTKDAEVYLVSPETAAASALCGCLTDPRTVGRPIAYSFPEKAITDDSGFLFPPGPEAASSVELKKGPNIGEIPVSGQFPDEMELTVSLKTGDHITTDHIMPAGAKVLPYRSNVPKLSEYCFAAVDPSFPQRAKALGKSVIVGGVNYGQGSSREHAALAPLYLGVRAVIAKSFARIHAANLVNAGILPLCFENEADYEAVSQGDVIRFERLYEGVEKREITATVSPGEKKLTLSLSLTDRQKEILKAGGLMAYTAKMAREAEQ